MDPKTQHMQQAREYAPRNHIAQGEHYIRHVSAMTAEGLHAKSAIAAELAHRDIQIAALAARVGVLTEALRFYGRGQHYVTDDAEDFDTVSGEPANWLFSGLDESSTSIEDGTIARRALRGEAIDWGEDGPPEQVAGEVAALAEPSAPVAAIEAPAEPVAPKALPQMPEERWYSVDRDGVAMLCSDEDDARANAEEAAALYPHRAPYRAMRLGDVAAAYAAGMDQAAEVLRALGAPALDAVRDDWTAGYARGIGAAEAAIRAAKGESAPPAAKPGDAC